MAFKMQMTALGFDFPEAHVEITACEIYRNSQMVRLYYNVYPNRAAAVAEPQKNIVRASVLELTFAQLAASLGPFYVSLQQQIQTLYPTASPAADVL